MTIGELLVKVNGDAAGLRRELDRATGDLQRFNAGVMRTGTALTIGLSAPIVALGVSVTKAAADMDSLTRGLTAVTGSAARTREQLDRLEIVARLPGLGFREAIRGSINLQAAGLSANTAERALKAFGNALATVGRGKADLDGVTRALTQIASKAKVSAEEINQLNERVPQIRQAMIAAFGSADTEKLGRAGITSAQFIEAIIKELEKLPPVAGGAANSFENLSDAMFRARVAIGEKLLPAVLPLVEGLATLLERVRTINPEVVRWGIAIAGVAAVVGPLVLVAGSLGTAISGLALVLGSSLLPVIAVGGPVLIALAALSAIWAKNKLDALAAASAADTYRASLIGMSRAQLEAARTHVTLDLAQIRTSQSQMRQSGAAFRPVMQVPSWWERVQKDGLAASLNPFSQGARPRIVLQETPAFRELGHAANDATARVHALDAAVRGLSATSAAAPAVVPTLQTGSGRDALAGLADGLQDLIREFEALQKFQGVASINLLPPDAADQIRLVNSLSNELDRMRDGLARFQAAGRAAPAGLTFGIEALNAQLIEAEKRLVNLARLFREASDGVLRGRADFKVNVDVAQVAPGGVTPRAGNVIERVGPQPLSFLDDLKNSVAGVVAQFSPMNLALAAVNAVLAPLQPLLDALLVPFTIMGEILATLIVPVLRVLFQPLKLLGIVVSYIGEVIAKVAGAIAGAIGSLVKGIGKLVNKLPGSPGDPLVKAGQGMIDLGRQFRDAASEMAEKRKQLEGLSFDDALDKTTAAANRLTEALINAAQGFKIDRFRFDATVGKGTTVTVPPPPPPIAPPEPPERPSRPRGETAGPAIGPTMNFFGPITAEIVSAGKGETDMEILERWTRAVREKALSNPSMRGLALQMGG